MATCVCSAFRTSSKQCQDLGLTDEEEHCCMSSQQHRQRIAICKLRYLKHHALAASPIHRQRQRHLHRSNSTITISPSRQSTLGGLFDEDANGLALLLLLKSARSMASFPRSISKEGGEHLRPSRHPFLSECINDLQHLLPPLCRVHQFPRHTHADLVSTLGHQQLLQQ